MRRTLAVVAAAAAVGALLSGCSPGREAAQEAYDACHQAAGEQSLLELDGSDVRVAVTGDAARAFSGVQDELTALQSGNPDFEGGGFVVALTVLMTVDCLVEETGYPGSSDQLSDGEEWEGWRYREESGAGSEFVATFTATS